MSDNTPQPVVPTTTGRITDAVANSGIAKLGFGSGVSGLLIWLCLTMQGFQTDLRDILVRQETTSAAIVALQTEIARVDKVATTGLSMSRDVDKALGQHIAETKARLDTWSDAMSEWRAEEDAKRRRRAAR